MKEDKIYLNMLLKTETQVCKVCSLFSDIKDLEVSNEEL